MMQDIQAQIEFFLWPYRLSKSLSCDGKDEEGSISRQRENQAGAIFPISLNKIVPDSRTGPQMYGYGFIQLRQRRENKFVLTRVFSVRQRLPVWTHGRERLHQQSHYGVSAPLSFLLGSRGVSLSSCTSCYILSAT